MNMRDILLARAMGGGSGGSGVDVTATPGQTIVVEEVDANGKPTKWKAAEYQEKICGTEEIVVCGETAVDISGGGMFVALAVPSVGSICKVKYNGTEYTCTAADGSALAGFECIILGNMALATGTGDTGEPFIAIIGQQGGEIMGQLMPMDGAESATLSIKGERATKIPFKYIPDEVHAYAPVYVNCGVDLDGNTSPAISVSVLESLIEAGRTVIIRWPTANFGTIYLQFCQDWTNADGKRRFGFSGGGYVIQLTPQDDDTYTVEHGTI